MSGCEGIWGEMMTATNELYWPGCYRDVRGSDRLFTSESVSHPAKMTGGLLFRILDEAEGRGWFQRGMTLLEYRVVQKR